jgi:hypothetical protein
MNSRETGVDSVGRLFLLCLWLAAGSGSAAAQYRPIAPPYLPPTPPPITIPQLPSSGQFNTAPVVVLPPPVVVVPPPPGPPPPAAYIESVDQLLQELAQCLAGGQPDLVLCLRGDMSSVAVRRLEACLGTNLIPENPAPVRACFASLPH